MRNGEEKQLKKDFSSFLILFPRKFRIGN